MRLRRAHRQRPQSHGQSLHASGIEGRRHARAGAAAVVHRAEFLAGVLALPVLSVRARFQDDGDDLSDPANSANAQAVRGLLGRGEAQRLDAQTFLFAGRRYRGSFTYTPEGEVVSTVPLEQYLYSVVSRE